jgi:MFS family permease
LLYAGQTISVVGDTLFLIALPFAVLDILDGTASDVGLVLAAQALPFALFVLVAGVWADRLPRVRLMTLSYVVRAVVQAVAAVLLISGEAQLWHLVAVCVVNGTADAFFMPALGGLMPSLVEKDDLQQANALLAVNFRFAMVLGPAAAGVLIVTSGPGYAIAIDAASFLVGALVIARIAPRPGAPPEHRRGFLEELRGGIREVLARPWLRAFFPVFSAYHFISLPCVLALGPVLADRELDGAASWAAITTAFGVGTVAGGLSPSGSSRPGPRWPSRPASWSPRRRRSSSPMEARQP